MSGETALPYPPDHPGQVRGAARTASAVASATDAAEATLRHEHGRLGTTWTGIAATAGRAEIDLVRGVAAEGSRAVTDAVPPLNRYGDTLEETRRTIDGLRGEYDDALRRHEARRDAIPDDAAGHPGLARVLLFEENEAHQSRLADIRRRYDAAMTALDTVAASVGDRLMNIAGRISPAPASGSAELVRAVLLERLPLMATHADVTVIRTPSGVVIDTTDGDDNVSVRRDPDTGEVIVVVNGEEHRFSAEEAEDLVIRTNGGNDTIDIDGDLQVGVTLATGDGDDVVGGGAGADVVVAGAGNDNITGGQGDDLVDGGDGDDSLRDAGFGLVILPGSGFGRRGGGNDTYVGGAGNDRIRSGDGDDTVDGGGGNDRIYAGGGDDRVAGGGGDDYIDGSTGNDRLAGDRGRDTVYGGDGDDDLAGGADQDYLEGSAGADSVDGGTGNDAVSGGTGNDRLSGGAGNDTVYTGRGTDVVSDAAGANTVYHQDDDRVDVSDSTTRVVIEIAEIPQEIVIDGSAEFQARVRADLEMLASSPAGAQMLEELGATGDTLTIRETFEENGFASVSNGQFFVDLNPAFHLDGDDGRVPPVVVTFHELAHAYDNMAGQRVDGFYVGPDADEAPRAIDTNGDGVADTAVDLDTDNDGILTLAEVDADGDGDVDDDDLDLNGDGNVTRAGDGWLPNTERQAVGLGVDHDQNPDTPDVPAETVVDHPPAMTENGLRGELGYQDRLDYR
jgi:hypothetical protein